MINRGHWVSFGTAECLGELWKVLNSSYDPESSRGVWIQQELVLDSTGLVLLTPDVGETHEKELILAEFPHSTWQWGLGTLLSLFGFVCVPGSLDATVIRYVFTCNFLVIRDHTRVIQHTSKLFGNKVILIMQQFGIEYIWLWCSENAMPKEKVM